MLQTLYRHVVLPAYEVGLKRRKAFRYWRDLERTQWLPRRELERLQFEALRRLLRHAYENCPYYRQAWLERGLNPEGLTDPAGFAEWPVITRETICQDRLRMRATVPRLRLMHKATGGSSGVPLHFDLDTDSDDRRTAAWHRGYDWAGGGPGTRQLYLWGTTLGQRTRWSYLKDRLYYRTLYRRLVLNSFELGEQSVGTFLEKLNRYRPDVIVAYTNPLYTFARMLDERGQKPYSPKGIIAGAEKLHDFQRALIERVFGAPVFETYGSREFMLMGAECDRHEGLHLTSEHLLVEVVDEDGRPARDGEEGDVVVTDLYNYGMPFVRYANGDRAVAGWGAGACGRGLPLLKKVVGRQLDIIHTPDGRRVAGEFFPHLVKDYPGVRKFQVVQDALDHVRLLVVPARPWDARERARLDREVGAVLGAEVRFEIVAVDDIPLTRSGKHRVVVSNLPGGPGPRHSIAEPETVLN